MYLPLNILQAISYCSYKAYQLSKEEQSTEPEIPVITNTVPVNEKIALAAWQLQAEHAASDRDKKYFSTIVE